MILNLCCLIGQGFRKRKSKTHIVSFVNGMHKRKIYKSRGTSVFVKNDILSLNIGVILFFFEVKFMNVFVKYCLGVWENDYTYMIMADLALNISRDNKISICPNYLRMNEKSYLSRAMCGFSRKCLTFSFLTSLGNLRLNLKGMIENKKNRMSNQNPTSNDP